MPTVEFKYEEVCSVEDYQARFKIEYERLMNNAKESDLQSQKIIVHIFQATERVFICFNDPRLEEIIDSFADLQTLPRIQTNQLN